MDTGQPKQTVASYHPMSSGQSLDNERRGVQQRPAVSQVGCHRVANHLGWALGKSVVLGEGWV